MYFRCVVVFWFLYYYIFFFFKQKTAYEMRISDWSSDVCSSDLTRMTAIVAEANSADPWTSRARPSFLYVMYALLLWAIPMGLIAAARPDMAKGIADGMNAYLAGIPEPLYALFGTGYLGYTAARAWGKAKGVEG